jgi:hypothetical protein
MIEITRELQKDIEQVVRNFEQSIDSFLEKSKTRIKDTTFFEVQVL